jgi:TctA family transporter
VSASLGLLAGTVGLPFVAIVVGLFSFSEVFLNVEPASSHLYETRLLGWLPTVVDLRTCRGAILPSLPFSG